jgi:hypothetical protein
MSIFKFILKPQKTEPDFIWDNLKSQIEEAKAELALAIQDENHATPEYLELAMERTKIAQAKLNCLYKQAKIYQKEEETNGKKTKEL